MLPFIPVTPSGMYSCVPPLAAAGPVGSRASKGAEHELGSCSRGTCSCSSAGDACPQPGLFRGESAGESEAEKGRSGGEREDEREKGGDHPQLSQLSPDGGARCSTVRSNHCLSSCRRCARWRGCVCRVRGGVCGLPLCSGASCVLL